VRDVAELHLRAMTDPAARGERFLAIAGHFMSVPEMAAVLKSRMGAAARRVPTRILPNWTVRLAALFDPSLHEVAERLDTHANATSEKARRMLGWTPRPAEEALVATAESLIRHGLLQAGKAA